MSNWNSMLSWTKHEKRCHDSYLFSSFVPCHGCHYKFVSLLCMIPQLLPCQRHIVYNGSHQVWVVMLYTYHGFSFVGHLNYTIVGFLKIEKCWVVVLYTDHGFSFVSHLNYTIVSFLKIEKCWVVVLYTDHSFSFVSHLNYTIVGFLKKEKDAQWANTAHLCCWPHVLFCFNYEYERKWQPGHGQFGPQWHDWQDLFRLPLDTVT